LGACHTCEKAVARLRTSTILVVSKELLAVLGSFGSTHADVDFILLVRVHLDVVYEARGLAS